MKTAIAVLFIAMLAGCTADGEFDTGEFNRAAQGLRAGTSSAAAGWTGPTYQPRTCYTWTAPGYRGQHYGGSGITCY